MNKNNGNRTIITAILIRYTQQMTADPWTAARTGSLGQLKAILKKHPHLLNEKDEHMNTPLYYACLCGHTDLVYLLSNRGARDNALGICYLNALNLEVRRILKSYNVYKHLTGRKKEARCPSIQDCISDMFEKCVMRDQEAATSSTCGQTSTEEISTEEDENYEYCEETETNGYSDLTLILKHGNKIVKEFPCHLFVLLAQGGPGMLEALLLGKTNDPTFDVANPALLRQRIHELKQSGQFIIDQQFDPCALEIFLRFIYTGRLIFPWRCQKQFQEEDAKQNKQMGEKSRNSLYSNELLFGNTLPEKRDVRLHIYIKEVQPIYHARHMPLILEVIQIAKFFRMDDLVKYIEEYLEHRKRMVSHFIRDETQKSQDEAQPNSNNQNSKRKVQNKSNKKPPSKKIDIEDKMKDIIAYLRNRNLDNFQNIFFKIFFGKTYLEVPFEVAQQRMRRWYFERQSRICVGPCKQMFVALRECCDIGITSLMTENDTSDFAICGPKPLLTRRSDFFKLLLSGGFSEAQTILEHELLINREPDFTRERDVPLVRIHDSSKQSLWSTLQYCFSDVITVSVASAIDVLMLSNRFGPWKKLQDHCIGIIRDNITTETVYDMFLIADMFCEQELKQDCFNLIKRQLQSRFLSSKRSAQEMHAEFELELREKGFEEADIEELFSKL